MLNLPVVVAAGGINSAGRTSQHHAYRRMVIDALPHHARSDTLAALKALTGFSSDDDVLMSTLIRRIESDYFVPSAVPWNRAVTLKPNNGVVNFEMAASRSGESLPADWQLEKRDKRRTGVTVAGEHEVLFPSHRVFEVGAAGQLPTGFRPGDLYASRNHPRALQMTVFAASDALADLGIEWEVIRQRVPADAISVYVSSSMGQLDDAGTGGMLSARATGRRVTSKQCPLGFAEMPGDFINAYLLHSLGNTGPALGACATFLYNLRLAAADIRSGRSRVAIIGASEAPILHTVMEGYAAMGALATDAGLRSLDGLDDSDAPDHRRACRPFGDNCGFTMAESSQVLVLFDDALVCELGAPIKAAVADVFVHADGAKKSITGPGPGNYMTMGRALTSLRGILGDERLARGGFVQAHGTGTPQNRVTESQIMNRMASVFGIDQWPVSAIKSFVGHSLGAAAGDQVSATLGIWEHGYIPPINTIDSVADDVAQTHLAFTLETTELEGRDFAVVNSKGFGGNNASAALLSPDATRELVFGAHGKGAELKWQGKNETVASHRAATESTRLRGEWAPLYRFDDGVLNDGDISFDAEGIRFGDLDVSWRADVPDSWKLK
ncbi:3-oxoacyl-(acyl-carrier-protein) synthase I [Luminiphilus syltensis NOR5-1B]|uniref:3-oxoacyl-(Acyl-carrier-protein) synthase I n=1 Tax=Luminiphilus syltensis NOR5-1B TaxID=565045 RepID=B8KXS9_9GAMM|nr:beta-ketoacyl synthase [Luminiphilus syltensis]EED34851.1 3-oxoacyl-(acyl-carrier-protein) synthase I [Luminiphilus syltensis NOR5-1B]